MSILRKLFKNQKGKGRKISKALLLADDEEFTLETRDASPAHLMTEIKSFSMLSEHKIRELESMEFEAGDYKWKLIIYPNGREIEKEGDEHISVYLSIVGTTSLPAGWEVNAFFNLLLFNHISDNYLCFRGKTRRFHAVNSEWGYSKLMARKSLTNPSSGFLFNDNCVFGAEVFVIKKQRVVEHVSMLEATDPYKRQWDISEIPKQKKRAVWGSEQFFAGGYNWKIILNSNGESRARGGYVSIQLVCVDSTSFAPHKKVYATCIFRLMHKRPGYTKIGRGWFTSSMSTLGFDEFVAIDDMLDPSKSFVITLDLGVPCQLEIELSVQAQHEALQLE